MKKVFNFISKCVGLIMAISQFFPEMTTLTFRWRVVIVALGTLLFFLSNIYSYISGKISFFSIRFKKIKIGISIDHPTNDEIVRFCNNEISNLGLSSKIIFESYTTNGDKRTKFENKVMSPRLDVVVWTSNKIKTLNKIPLHFTYKDTANHLVDKIVRSELRSLVSVDKMFNLNKENIDIDLNLEKNNLADFSLYIVAVCTSLFRGISQGTYVFEKLYIKISNKNGILKNNVKRRLKDLYSIKGRDLIYNNKNYPEALKILKKGYEIDPLDPNLLASMAFAKFLVGEEVEAEKLSAELLQNHTGFPIAHLDAAFFRIKNKKYKSALKQYLCYKKSNPDPATSLEAITFLSEILDKNSQEIGYLFGRAFLKRIVSKKLERIGESNYIQDFNTFILRADQNMNYRDLIEYAQKIVNK